MQTDLRLGPFSSKLNSVLLESKQLELAQCVQQYYLSIKVLGHVKGVSYRELFNTQTPFFVLKASESIISDNIDFA